MIDYMNDPFSGDDPFGGQQTLTPGFNTLKTTGTNKLLVVLFVVDCSRTMEGERINAVNAALTELKSTLQDIKNDNGLELKIAIMSFTSSPKWEVMLTDIDEVSLKKLNTRAGLTEYGNAFHELNKVLRKEQFMKHTGKIAPPAIMFLTDGGPTDDYESDLDDLLKNSWFANASRSAVLMGDAIHDNDARNAVRKFVGDPDQDIVGAEDSTVIIQKIKLATMHTVAGDPMDKGTAKNFNNPPSPAKKADDPFADFDDSTVFADDPTNPNSNAGSAGDTSGTPFDSNPFSNDSTTDPFNNNAGGAPSDNSSDTDPFNNNTGTDPFNNNAGTDPFGNNSGTDPFNNNAGTDPFDTTPGTDPFDNNSGTDPFNNNAGSDPFDTTPGTDPFATTPSPDPFDSGSDSDPFGDPADGNDFLGSNNVF